MQEIKNNRTGIKITGDNNIIDSNTFIDLDTAIDASGKGNKISNNQLIATVGKKREKWWEKLLRVSKIISLISAIKNIFNL